MCFCFSKKENLTPILCVFGYSNYHFILKFDKENHNSDILNSTIMHKKTLVKRPFKEFHHGLFPSLTYFKTISCSSK